MPWKTRFVRERVDQSLDSFCAWTKLVAMVIKWPCSVWQAEGVVMDIRSGEQERHWFRSERFSLVNGQWYFQTREGTVEGPFDDVREAEMELLLYLRHAEDSLFQGDRKSVV